MEPLELAPGESGSFIVEGVLGSAIDYSVSCSIGEPSSLDPELWTWDSGRFILDTDRSG